jgi:hypothetical protein
VLTSTLRGSIPPTSRGHRLRLGLPGYLIPFAPLAFAPERQMLPRMVPSPLVFFQISTHFTTPPGVPHPSEALKFGSFPTTCPVKPDTVGKD